MAVAVASLSSKRNTGGRREFRGVYRERYDRYGAQIRHSKGEARWLGTYDTVEDAARAYDAAAVQLHGATAITNFSFKKPPTATAANEGVKSSMEMLALDLFSDSVMPVPQLDDLLADLPQEKLQLVDEFLEDMEFADVTA
ncbi:hypothetical protein ACQ4PT_051339 [Festuca glaucescens]